jgi:guanylate kinase
MIGKIAIVGAASSGKDYLRKRMEMKNLTFGVSCTTRPSRPGENEGTDYYFTTDTAFDILISNDQLVEFQDFNGWRYGITKDEFEKCDVLILNADAVTLLTPYYRNRIFVVYLEIAESIRRERLELRGDIDDLIERRIAADREQFGNFLNFDCKITNEDF